MKGASRSHSAPAARRLLLALVVALTCATAAVAIDAGGGAGAGGGGAIGLASAQAQNETGTNATGTNTTGANGTNATAPAPGTAIPASCEDIRQNPTGQGPDYRVVQGACAIELNDGEVLSNVWFKADGERVDIWARGSGWTIRNVAITNHGANDDPPLNLRVTARDGVGLVHNFYAADIESNVVFVHPKHTGKIRFEAITWLRVAEDASYSSRPGNPPSITTGDPKIEGRGGTVGFRDAYLKNIGIGPRAGYGLRLGSDGSYVINATIVDTTGPALANTFASGEHPSQRSDAFDGVLFRNVDVIQRDGGTGLRVNNHQSGLKSKRDATALTYLEDVDIEAAEPIERNEAGGQAPIIRGDYGTNPDPTPPAGAPRSPERAASGIGGGTGSIGGPVAGPGGGDFVAVLTRVGAIVALGVVGLVLVVLIIAVTLVAWLERDGNGGFP